MFSFFADIWDIVFINPILNAFAFFYDILFNNIGLSIIVVTVIIRVLLTPLTIRQVNQTKRMQKLAPQIRQLQKRYSGKDRETRRKLSQETFKLYKQAGVNPIGCLGPLIIQIPIWLAVYRAVLFVVPVTPEGFVTLGRAIYSFNPALAQIPFDPLFLGVNLVANVAAAPTPWQFLLPILVGGTLWLQQTVTSSPTGDLQQARQQRLFLWMLPIIFGVFTYFFPAGLALYIFASNIVGFVTYVALGNRPNIKFRGRDLFGGGKGDGDDNGGAAPDSSKYHYQKEHDRVKELEIHRENRRRGNRTGSKRSGSKSGRHRG